MRNRATLYCIVILSFYFYAALAVAADYKEWVKLLPTTINGLPLAKDPEGTNMNMGDMKTSMILCNYGTGANTIKLSIVSDANMISDISGTPSGDSSKDEPMQFQTDEMIFKTATIEGYHADLSDNKSEHRSSMHIYMKGKGIVTLDVEPDVGVNGLEDIIKQIPLQKIAATITE